MPTGIMGIYNVIVDFGGGGGRGGGNRGGRGSRGAGRGGGGSRGGAAASSNGADHPSITGHSVHMRGLPFSATDQVCCLLL